MGLELLENGEDYLVLRSTITGSLYAVVLEAPRGVEQLRTAPLAAWLQSGKVIGPGDAPAKPKPAATGTPRSKPGQVREVVVKLLQDGVERTINGIAEAGGVSRGGAYSTLKGLQEEGVVALRQQPRSDGTGLPENWYVWKGDRGSPKPAAKQIPPPSERDLEILEAVKAHPGVPVAELNTIRGKEPANTDIYRNLRKLEALGLIRAVEDTVEDENNATGHRKRRVFYANDPIGPESESQGLASESTSPVEAL